MAPVVTIEALSLAEQETFEEQLSDIEVFGLMEGVVIVQSWVVPAKRKKMKFLTGTLTADNIPFMHQYCVVVCLYCN